MFTQRNFWAHIPLSLQEVSARLADCFGLLDPEFGADGPEEWFEGFAGEGVSFYIYRHGGTTAPLRFIVTPYVTDPMVFGCRLAACFGQSISYGVVTYHGEDLYGFSEISRYDNVVA